ncbi:MAG: 3-keto-5-aminohexanoate cleavage enzyme [Gammaproteobacteria bacterium]|jgi:3-keto-5-aminohexanoate cleavage enzyme|nr:3-keto-5-aminohexanoate cleavage enzyme [Gammaproteobacteria bacterium]
MAKLAWHYADTFEFMEQTRAGFPPAMICVAINGGIQGKEAHDKLPEHPDEIADAVHAAYEAGASMVHVHARDPHDLTLGARRTPDWQEVNRKIRERCPDIVVNNTTGGDLQMNMEERLSCLDALPDVASLNLTPDMSRFTMKARVAPLPHPRPETEIDVCIPFTYGIVENFAAQMKRRGIKPEMETYHSGGSWVIRDLIDRRLVEPPYLIQTVMGAQTASYPTPENVLQLLKELPEQTVWLCSGIGPFQLPLTTLALLMGGHARVGLEDNLYHSRGRKFVDNAESVKRVVRIAEELNRKISTPAETRELLGLPATPHRRTTT